MTKTELHEAVADLILNNWTFENDDEALAQIDDFLNQLLSE
ncbi:hypothetical protein ACJROX_10835 [Pseudalkalibacillus sp. A8]